MSRDLPQRVDLRENLGPVRDQGPRNTCLSFAVTTCHEAVRTLGLSYSEESLHWGARRYGTNQNGCALPWISAALNDTGQAYADHWPYDPAQDESVAGYEPPSAALEATPWHTARTEAVALTVEHIKQCLAQATPIVAIVRMFETFWMLRGNRIELPDSPNWIPENHALVVAGYDDTTGEFLIRNSWGEAWGERGYAYAPFTFIVSHSIAAVRVMS